MRNITFITACIAVLALAACGKSPAERAAEAAIEASTGGKADVDAKTGAVTVQTDKGEMKINSGDGATLPATFPKDVFLPDDYKVVSSMEVPGALVVQIEAPGAVAAMYDKATKHMVGQGWKQRMAMQNDADNQMVVYEKDKRTASLSLSKNTDTNGVTLGVQIGTQQQ